MTTGIDSIEEAIDQAISAGDVAHVRELLCQHPEYLAHKWNGYLPWLCLAVDQQDKDMVKALLDLGCNVNASRGDSSSETALWSALKDDDLEMARLLLEHGADPKGHKLVVAAIAGSNDHSLELVRLLEQYGADLHRIYLDEIGDKPMNALSIASDWDKNDVAEYLRSKGGSLPLPNALIPDELERRAINGWMTTDEFDNAIFQSKGPTKAGDLPAIAIRLWKKGLLARLAIPSGPFSMFLDALHLQGKHKIADEDMKEVAALSHLKVLKLGGTGIGDQGLRELVRLKDIEHLDISETRVTDNGMKELSALVRLKWLALSHNRVTDEGLRELTRLGELKTLYLVKTKVTEAGLKHVSALSRLQHLHLDIHVTDVGLRELSALKELRTLNLGGATLTPSGVAALAALSNLEHLHLGEVKVVDANLKVLAELSHLHTLVISGATSTALRDLASVTQLHTLRLSGRYVTDSVLKTLACLKNVKTLDLSSSAVTDAGLKELVGFSALTELSLSQTSMTDAGLKHVAALKHLAKLDLSTVPATEKGIEELRHALPLTTINAQHLGSQPDLDVLNAPEERAGTAEREEVARSLAGEVVAYFIEHFGPVQPQALSEIVPTTDPHISIHHIPASKERNCITLFTTGMSDRPMMVPEGEDEEYRWAEIYIQLPASWDLSKLGDPNFAWPIHALRSSASYPHENNTWLGGPITLIANDDPPQPLAPKIKFTTLFLLADKWFTTRDGRKVQLYRMMPLYTEERALEMAEGVDELMRRFDANNIGFVVDVKRPNVAKLS